MLIGEGSVDDKAVGEEVEFEFGEAPGVISRAVRLSDKQEWLLTVTNDRTRPVDFELVFDGDQRIVTPAKLARRDGLRVWQTRLPANGSATLRYSIPEGN